MLDLMSLTHPVVTAVVSLTMMLGACGDNSGQPDANPADAIPAEDSAADANTVDILEALVALDGVTGVVEHPSEQPAYRYFTMMFEQPVDHDDPEGQKFGQFLSLHHRDYGAPMILATTGYANYMGDRLTEPTQLLRANQLVVEHRFFADSRPDPADWDLLRIRQAAGDHHRRARRPHGQRGQRLLEHARLLGAALGVGLVEDAVLRDDVEADVDALVADVDRRPSYELLHVALRLVAEAAPEDVAGTRFLRHP